jgi:hypothetical protein
MGDLTRISQLLSALATSLAQGKLDERALDALAAEKKSVEGVVGDLDGPTQLRWAVLRPIIEERGRGFEKGLRKPEELAAMKTWPRQNPIATAEELAAMKTWPRQNPIATAEELAAMKTWPRQNPIATAEQLAAMKTWPRQNPIATAEELAAMKTWPRQNPIATAHEHAVMKTWGRQNPSEVVKEEAPAVAGKAPTAGAKEGVAAPKAAGKKRPKNK